MSRYTTTLMEILQSELQNRGYNEFVNKGHLTFNDSEFAFIQKILRFDDDVHNIVNRTFFKGFKFNDERIDRYFKEAFVTRFLDREINRQTVEAFASQVLYVTLTREDYIFTVFGSEMQKYLEQHTENLSEDRGIGQENSTEQGQSKERQQQKTHDNYEDNNTNDRREANSTLPQSEVNINVDNTVLDYADTNDISREKGHAEGTKDGTLDNINNGETDTKRNTQSENTSNHEALNKTYLIDNLKQIEDMREKIFEAYDKKCFLHIW